MTDTIVPVQALVLQRIQVGATKGHDTITHTVWDPVMDPNGNHVIDSETQKYVETPRLVVEEIDTEVPEYALPGDVIDISHFHDLGTYIRLGILQPILPSEDGTVEMYMEARDALKGDWFRAQAELAEERDAIKADREAVAAERADLEADRAELRALLDEARASQGQAPATEDTEDANDAPADAVAEDVTDDSGTSDVDDDDNEVDVEEFHTGGGWYQIPGVEGKVQGADKAREALASVTSNQEGDSTGE